MQEDSASARKVSFVATMRANLESSNSASMVPNIDNFYKQQKKKKVGDTKKKGEAAHMLHHFRGSSVAAEGTPKKVTPIHNVSTPAQMENGAANRAAAALFLSSARKPSSANSPVVKSSVSIRSLADFYQCQRAQRQLEVTTRQNATNLSHGFNSLMSRKHPSETYIVDVANKSTEVTRRIFEANKSASDPLLPQTVAASASKLGEEEKEEVVATTPDEDSNRGQKKINKKIETMQIPVDETGTDKEAASTKHSDADLNSMCPSPAENPVVAVDYKASDYRGFVFCVHEKHGLLLLHCTRKRKKGPHHQLPGGHVDEPEFLAAAKASDDRNTQLLIAAQMGAARELYEETGLDVRDRVYRMTPAALRSGVTTDTNGQPVLACELNFRLYFYLSVTDDDFISADSVDATVKLAGPMTAVGAHLRLRLSVEHSGFMFEKDPEKSAKLLEQHSGGNGSKALLMASTKVQQESVTAEKGDAAELEEQNNDGSTSSLVFAPVENPVVAVDYKSSDYRGFILCVHEQHGLLLLHCTRKPKKGPHYQLPGGHVDEREFLAAAQASHDPHAQLMIAAQMGAARELYEETGIDVRDKVYRMEPAALRNAITTNKNGKFVLTCEIKKRLYFFLPITDDDFNSPDSVDETFKLTGPMTAVGAHLRLRLSVEHSGFMFEKDPEKSAKLLEQHSGGNGSKALLMSMHRREEEAAAIDESMEVSSVEELMLDSHDAALPLTKQDSPSSSIEESKLDGQVETEAQEVVQLGVEEQSKSEDQLLGEMAPLIDEEGDTDELDEGLKSINLKELPADLLPPPERKNIFTCCFECDQPQ
jgi:8-oxo-dGTP pyrophosphatase MutT (NUDIX family)